VLVLNTFIMVPYFGNRFAEMKNGGEKLKKRSRNRQLFKK